MEEGEELAFHQQASIAQEEETEEGAVLAAAVPVVEEGPEKRKAVPANIAGVMLGLCALVAMLAGLVVVSKLLVVAR